MIGYFILGVCLLAAFGLIVKFLLTTNPKGLAKLLRIAACSFCAAAAIFMLITGRFALGLPLAFVAAALLRRWALPRLGPKLSQSPGQSTGNTSKVETAYLRLELDHDTGAMRGEVLHGTFAGQNFMDLHYEQILELLAECQRHDGQSAQILEAFLDRNHGPEWRYHAENDAEKRPTGSGPMTMKEACDILGLETNPSPNEIRKAHKRLMLKLHPDKGGSSYLAAKINQAKDILLGA